MATSQRYPKNYPFFGNDGNLLSLGELSWFHAQTTTPHTVYADAAESVPLPNPLTLNASGRAVDSGGDLVAIYFSDSSGNDVKEVIKDSDGATLSSEDDIPRPVDPTEGLSDFSKPLTQWSTDTASSVDIATSGLGRGRLADTSSNNITYNLPSASAAGNGKGIVIKKTAAANSVTLDGDGSETIDGSATFSWTEDGRVYVVVSDGANWRIAWTYLAQINSGDVDAASDTVAGVQENADQSEMEAASSTTLNVTPGRTHHHPGVAKVWAYVSESGGDYTLEDSYNVTSITDNGTGDITVTIDTDFSSANYAVVGTCHNPGDPNNVLSVTVLTQAAGSVQIGIKSGNDTTVVNDDQNFSISCFGDQ